MTYSTKRKGNAMKKRYAVYEKGCSFPLYVFDNEEDAKKMVRENSAWSANFYYECVWVKSE